MLKVSFKLPTILHFFPPLTVKLEPDLDCNRLLLRCKY